MMLLSLHIVAIAALAGICGSIGYQIGIKEGFRVSRLEGGNVQPKEDKENL